MKTEKKYLIYGIGLVLLTLIGISLAYFITEITGDSKSVSVTTGDLRVVFTDTDGSITGTDIEPSWSESKTFSVENKTNSEYKYNIVIEDLVNTFKTTGYLVYKISSSDGGYNMTEYKDVPKASTATDVVLAYSVNIPSKTIHNYTIEIKYLNSTTVDQSEDMNSTLSGNLYISKGTTEPTLANVMLRDNPTISERTDFSVTNVANTTGTIYKTNKTEDGSLVYYYSGNTTNNWVKLEGEGECVYNGMEPFYVDAYNEIHEFVANSTECTSTNLCGVGQSVGNYLNFYVGLSETFCEEIIGGTYLNEKATWYSNDTYWRIIRTNIDDSVRLLYAGLSADTMEGNYGSSTYSDTTCAGGCVGYMYGGNTSLADNRANTTSSVIKNRLNTFYEQFLLNNYDKYISKTAIYCNDRSIDSSQYTWSATAKFYYGAYTRLNTNKAPNYKCGANTSGSLFESTQAIEDKFSVSTSGGGNGNLTYGIALMTGDEVIFAGSTYNPSSNVNAWFALNSNGDSVSSSWWTMTPYSLGRMFYVYGGGAIATYDLSNYEGGLYQNDVNIYYYNAVRPVISLDKCTHVTGTGTPTDPYVINESASTCS